MIPSAYFQTLQTLNLVWIFYAAVAIIMFTSALIGETFYYTYFTVSLSGSLSKCLSAGFAFEEGYPTTIRH